MTKDLVYQFIKQHKLAVVATIATENRPEAAVVGIAVSENLEIIFDTVRSSRKYANLIANPNIAVVIGWEDETTVQYEGIAIELKDSEDNSYREIYYASFPDGRQRAETWDGLTHFKIKPKWIRYSNFNEPQVIEEIVY